METEVRQCLSLNMCTLLCNLIGMEQWRLRIGHIDDSGDASGHSGTGGGTPCFFVC